MSGGKEILEVVWNGARRPAPGPPARASARPTGPPRPHPGRIAPQVQRAIIAYLTTHDCREGVTLRSVARGLGRNRHAINGSSHRLRQLGILERVGESVGVNGGLVGRYRLVPAQVSQLTGGRTDA